MGNRFKKIGFVNLLVFLVAGQAMAGPELSFKTGYTVSEDTYPYAFDSAVSSDPIIPILAPFGSGPFAGVGLAFSNVIGDYGLEIESNFFSMRDRAEYGFAQEGGNCDFFSVRDLISLVHDECMSGADTKSVSAVLSSRASVSRHIEDLNVTALAGIGTLAFANEITGRMYYDVENSAQLRQNSFAGTGVSLGIRHERQIGDGNTLNIEGFAGLYHGESKVKVEGVYLAGFDAYENSEQRWVRSVDLSVSLGRTIEFMGLETDVEFGAMVSHIDPVLDTANYNEFSAPTGPSSVSGSQSEGISNVTLFLGTSFDL